MTNTILMVMYKNDKYDIDGYVDCIKDDKIRY